MFKFLLVLILILPLSGYSAQVVKKGKEKVLLKLTKSEKVIINEKYDLFTSQGEKIGFLKVVLAKKNRCIAKLSHNAKIRVKKNQNYSLILQAQVIPETTKKKKKKKEKEKEKEKVFEVVEKQPRGLYLTAGFNLSYFTSIALDELSQAENLGYLADGKIKFSPGLVPKFGLLYRFSREYAVHALFQQSFSVLGFGESYLDSAQVTEKKDKYRYSSLKTIGKYYLKPRLNVLPFLGLGLSYIYMQKATEAEFYPFSLYGLGIHLQGGVEFDRPNNNKLVMTFDFSRHSYSSSSAKLWDDSLESTAKSQGIGLSHYAISLGISYFFKMM